MNTRRHPRTLQEAFGPYASHDLQPMRERRAETSNAEIVAYIVGLVAVLAVVHYFAQ